MQSAKQVNTTCTTIFKTSLLWHCLRLNPGPPSPETIALPLRHHCPSAYNVPWDPGSERWASCWWTPEDPWRNWGRTRGLSSVGWSSPLSHGSEMWGWELLWNLWIWNVGRENIIELVDLKCGDGNYYRTCGSEMWGWELL